MTNPFHDEKLESRWNKFMIAVKSELTDKNKNLQSITDLCGENPKPLDELIWRIPTTKGTTWGIDDNYEISDDTKSKIEEIFNRY
jgi:hypothetical protein